MAITLLPSRVPIVDKNGLPTPEFDRLMRAIFERIGGPNGLGSDDLAMLSIFGSLDGSEDQQDAETEPDANARLAELAKRVDELEQQLATAVQPDRGVEKKVADLEVQIALVPDYATALGTLAKQNANAVAITGGTISGITSLSTTSATNLATSSGSVGIGTASPSGNFKLETPSSYANAARLGQVSIGLSGGGYPQIGYNFRTTSTTDAYNYDVGDVSSVVRFNAGTVDFMRAGSGSAGSAITYSSMGRFSSTGLTVVNGFGCNGKGPQGPAASGGTLTGVINALVANGILSS